MIDTKEWGKDEKKNTFFRPVCKQLRPFVIFFSFKFLSFFHFCFLLANLFLDLHFFFLEFPFIWIYIETKHTSLFTWLISRRKKKFEYNKISHRKQFFYSLLINSIISDRKIIKRREKKQKNWKCVNFVDFYFFVIFGG